MRDRALMGDGAALRFLDLYLEPLAPLLAERDITDLYINRPGEVWVEWLDGRVERRDCPGLGEQTLWHLASQIAAQNHQAISREAPLLSATLPDGARVQIVAPPATRGPMAVAIRKHVKPDLTLMDYVQDGALAAARVSLGAEDRPALVLPDVGDAAACARFIGDLVRARRNILVCGGTSSGKTTFLNALVREIPAHERLIVIEDTAELALRHANAIGLISIKGEMGEARVTADDLLQAALRMRPDRILLGEMRGNEAYTFLRAVNTGHPGSFSTIHADSPEGAIEQMVLIIQQSGVAMKREDIVATIRGTVDAIILLERRDGQRRIARIMITRPVANY